MDPVHHAARSARVSTTWAARFAEKIHHSNDDVTAIPLFAKAAAADRLSSDIPSNHSPHFAPVIQPTLDTGTTALVAAALSWLAG